MGSREKNSVCMSQFRRRSKSDFVHPAFARGKSVDLALKSRTLLLVPLRTVSTNTFGGQDTASANAVEDLFAWRLSYQGLTTVMPAS